MKIAQDEKNIWGLIKFVDNEFIKVQWDVDGSITLCEISDVSLKANSELKPKFQIRITLAADYVSDEEKDNKEYGDRDEEQDVNLSIDNVPTKLPIRKWKADDTEGKKLFGI